MTVSDQADPAAQAAGDYETRREWRDVAHTLDAIVASPPEAGSVLDQLAHSNVLPDLADVLRLVAGQGTQFLRSSIDIAPPGARGVELSPVGPLARSALLAFSKVVSISAPLCWEVRGIGPALQHHHDGLVDMVIEQDRHVGLQPSSNEATIWCEGGRSGMVRRIESLRQALGEKPLKPNGPSAFDQLVTEGSWVVDAQEWCVVLRQLDGAPRDEFTNRIRWAWHRASVVAHAGFGSKPTPAGISLVYLGVDEASLLIRCAAELAVAAQRVLGGVWFVGAAPSSFSFNAEHRLPKSAPRLVADP